MNKFFLKIGNHFADLGDTKLSLVLTSPYPLMAEGYQGGNFVFNFSLPSTPELKKELSFAHRPGSLPAIIKAPFLIEASGIRYSGTAEISEASSDTYEVLCPVGNGDFNIAAKEVKLPAVEMGETSVENPLIDSAVSPFMYDFYQSQFTYFSIEEVIKFKNISLNSGELNGDGSSFTSLENRTVRLKFGVNCEVFCNYKAIRIYKNDVLLNTLYLADGNNSKECSIILTVGDVISWKVFISAAWYREQYEITGSVFAGATLEIVIDLESTAMINGAILRYPDVNFAVFPLENPYVLDNWPDDFYQIDNDSIKVLYQKYFKVINYWTKDQFPELIFTTVDGVYCEANNLFIPFPYIAFIIKCIARHFNYAIQNNVFENELKYAVLINHFVENTFLSDDPKKLIPNSSFYLNNHVPNWTVYDFLQHLCKLFGLGYEVDNELQVIEFNFVDDIIKSTDSIDISHLVVSHPVVKYSSKLKAFKLEQKIPSNDKYFSQVKSLDGLNYKGVLTFLSELPEDPAINDCYFVKFVDAYMVYGYNTDTYAFSWIIHGRRFTSEIVSGEDPSEIASEICPLMQVVKGDRMIPSREWSIPASHQPGNFESAPETFKTEWKPGIVWYHGLYNDNLGEAYPFASSGIISPGGSTIPGATLSLTLDGASGLYEKKWKTYLNWRINAKPVTVQIVPDRSFLQNFRFKKKVTINAVRYLIVDVRGNIGINGPEVFELSLLAE